MRCDTNKLKKHVCANINFLLIFLNLEKIALKLWRNLSCSSKYTFYNLKTIKVVFSCSHYLFLYTFDKILKEDMYYLKIETSIFKIFENECSNNNTDFPY